MSDGNGPANAQDRISPNDALFLDRVRGLSILRVVLVHLGLSWFFPPYSQFVHIFLPLLFFVSGAVSFYSFKRAPNLGNYSFRRLLSIVMPYYVIVVGAFSYVWLTNLRLPQLNVPELLDWLFISPRVDGMPFPMGQVWFIHAMAIMIIVALPIFLVSRKSPLPLLIGTILSVLLALIHQINDVNKLFYFFGHNFYQALSNIGFFLFGAFYYSTKQIFTSGRLLVLLALSALSLAVNVAVFDVDINMANHSYAPDFYYISGCFLAIFLVLLCKPIIDGVLNKIRVFDWFFLFLSRHAYSVFMLHSLVLFLTEKWLGLVDVGDDFASALLKIFLVVSLSCLVAVPVTRISKRATTVLQNSVINRGPGSEVGRLHKFRE